MGCIIYKLPYRRSYRQGLSCKVNEIDLTCLDVKETQSRIDRLVNGMLLPHTVFFGQHMGPGRGLVDSTDRTLKEHLAMVFPLDNWKAARGIAREKMNSLHDLILTSKASLDAAKTVLCRLQEADASTRRQCAQFEFQREDKLAALDAVQNRLHAENARSNEDSVAYLETFPTSADQVSVVIEDYKQQLSTLEEDTGTRLDAQRESAASQVTSSNASLVAAEELQSRISALLLKSRYWEAERERKISDIRKYIQVTEKELQAMESHAGIDDKWKAASSQMRICDEKLHELMVINVEHKIDQRGTIFSKEWEAVHNSRNRVSALKEERVRLETSLRELNVRLVQSENVSMVPSNEYDGGLSVSSPSIPNACETCLRPFDGELYERARSQLQLEAVSIEKAMKKTGTQLANENMSYRAALSVLRDQIDRERRSIIERKAKVSETFGALRSERSTRDGLTREISELEKKIIVMRRDQNLYLKEIYDISYGLPCPNDEEHKTVDNIMAAAAKYVTDKNTKLSTAENHYNAVMAEFQAREYYRTETVSRRRDLQAHIDDLLDIQKEYQRIETARISIQQDVNPYMESLKLVQSELNAETSKLEKREREFSGLKDSLNTFKALDVAFGPRGVPSFVLEEGLLWLERLTSMYLDRLSGGELMLQIRAFSDYKSSNRVEGDNKEIISKKVFVRTGGDSPVFRERSLRQLSGGQRRRCSVAFALAFADLAHERAGFRSSMVVMDEILQSLDEDGRKRISKILPDLIDETRSPRNTILVVAQDEAPEIAGLAHGGIDIVSRKNDQSEVLLDSIDSILT